jgi:hypothetical protein
VASFLLIFILLTASGAQAEEPETAMSAAAKPAASAEPQPAATVELQPDADAEASAAAMPLPSLRRRKPISTTARLTTGFAADFQLTLGGEFSDGIAQQNSFTFDVKHLLRDDSTLRFAGWNTLDTKDGSNDWIASINYIQPLKVWESGNLLLNLGAHRWQFPSVQSGGNDYIADSGLIWNQQAGPIGFTLDANVKTLAYAQNRAGTGGQIYYFRATTAHPLRQSGKLSLALVHGPSYTYANRFYTCKGARVFRYEMGLSLKYGRFGAETMFRPQMALQDRIPEHNFWSAGMSFVLW